MNMSMYIDDTIVDEEPNEPEQRNDGIEIEPTLKGGFVVNNPDTEINLEVNGVVVGAGNNLYQGGMKDYTNKGSERGFDRVLTSPAMQIRLDAPDLEALRRRKGIKGANDTYEIITPIHANDKCIISHAVGIDTGRNVVVKQYRDERFFKHELTINGILNPDAEHESILLADEFIENNRGMFSVSRYIDGGDLQQVLERFGKLSPLECMSIFPSICDALEYMHGKGVVHRDIKAANILVESLDENSPGIQREMFLSRIGRVSPKVIDYDIAWHRLVADPVPVGAVCGTVSYMSPQVYVGEIDPRNDIFAAGIVLYFMLTLKHPFNIKPTEHALIAYKRMKEEPVSNPSDDNPNVTKKLSEVVMTTIAKSHEERYQSARELKDAFLDAMKDYYFLMQ